MEPGAGGTAGSCRKESPGSLDRGGLCVTATGCLVVTCPCSLHSTSGCRDLSPLCTSGKDGAPQGDRWDCGCWGPPHLNGTHAPSSSCASARAAVCQGAALCASVVLVMVLQGSPVAGHLCQSSGSMRPGQEAPQLWVSSSELPLHILPGEGCVGCWQPQAPRALAWLCPGRALLQGPGRAAPPPWELGSCWELRLHLNCHLHFPINTRLHN